jgi:hypothetical protein
MSLNYSFVSGCLVDLTGIEPVTSSMPWKRAPSCATGPLFGKNYIYSQTCGLDSQTGRYDWAWLLQALTPAAGSSSYADAVNGTSEIAPQPPAGAELDQALRMIFLAHRELIW